MCPLCNIHLRLANEMPNEFEYTSFRTYPLDHYKSAASLLLPCWFENCWRNTHFLSAKWLFEIKWVTVHKPLNFQRVTLFIGSNFVGVPTFSVRRCGLTKLHVFFDKKPAVSATTIEFLLISPLNYIRNIDFFLFGFLKYRDFMFFVISIFVVVRERV